MQRIVRPLALVTLVALFVWAYRSFDLARYLSVDGMKELVATAGAWAPLAFMAICIAGIFMHFPEFLLIALGGIALGGLKAFAYGWIACLIGATSTFVLVRYFGREYFQREISARFGRLRALDDRLERDGFRTVLVLRLLLFMAPPLNWLLGATRVKLPHYVAGTAIGMIPGMATAIYFADSLASSPPGRGDLRLLAGAAVVLVLLAIGRAASRRFLGERV